MRVLLGLALVGLTAATACGGQRAGAGGRGLTYYESYDPRSLDPALSTDVPTGEMVTLAFDGLTQFDPDGRLLPALADRWTTGRDASGRRDVFHLRPGVKFHDGTPLTAAAVRASMLRVLSPATRGGRPWPLYPIAGAEAYADGRAGDVSGITVLGDSSVAFTLTEPLAIFPKFLAMPVASVVPTPPPSDLAQRAVGTGPWRFVAWQHDDYLLFARNPSYWGGAPAGDTLMVRIIPEPLTRAAEFEASRLSVIEVPFGETARWRRERPDQLVEKPARRVVYVALDDRRGRLGDRDASSQREAARKGAADMVILDWWADYPDADNFLYPLFYSGSFGPGGNYAFYSDPSTDSLILRARRTTDDAARTTLYRRIDERVYRAAPWLYLWFPTDLWARRPELLGWDLPVIFNGQRWTHARVAPP